MAGRVASLFSERATDLFTFVYGRAPSTSAPGASGGADDDDDGDGGERRIGGGKSWGRGGGGAGGLFGDGVEGGDDEDDSDGDDLFQPVRKKTLKAAASDVEAVDGEWGGRL